MSRTVQVIVASLTATSLAAVTHHLIADGDDSLTAAAPQADCDDRPAATARRPNETAEQRANALRNDRRGLEARARARQQRNANAAEVVVAVSFNRPVTASEALELIQGGPLRAEQLVHRHIGDQNVFQGQLPVEPGSDAEALELAYIELATSSTNQASNDPAMTTELADFESRIRAAEARQPFVVGYYARGRGQAARDLAAAHDDWLVDPVTPGCTHDLEVLMPFEDLPQIARVSTRDAATVQDDEAAYPPPVRPTP